MLGLLGAARLKQGRLLGRMERLGFDLKPEAQIAALTHDVLRRSEIEGEQLDRAGVLRKADLWKRHGAHVRTDRAPAVLNRYLDGCEGPVTARKWAALGGCSVPTAQHDLAELLAAGVVVQNPGGSKNTSYGLA